MRIFQVLSLFVLLIFTSLVTMGGCEVDCNDSPTLCSTIFLGALATGAKKNCDIVEQWCPGLNDCIPIEFNCCSDSMGNFVDVCKSDTPICCPSGECSTDYELCSDVIECPEEVPQPCGPECIEADAICCNDGLDTDHLLCSESSPICCPLGTSPQCVNDINECCEGDSVCGE